MVDSFVAKYLRELDALDRFSVASQMLKKDV